jgi:hypothetical protein
MRRAFKNKMLLILNSTGTTDGADRWVGLHLTTPLLQHAEYGSLFWNKHLTTSLLQHAEYGTLFWNKHLTTSLLQHAEYGTLFWNNHLTTSLLQHAEYGTLFRNKHLTTSLLQHAEYGTLFWNKHLTTSLIQHAGYGTLFWNKHLTTSLLQHAGYGTLFWNKQASILLFALLFISSFFLNLFKFERQPVHLTLLFFPGNTNTCTPKEIELTLVFINPKIFSTVGESGLGEQGGEQHSPRWDKSLLEYVCESLSGKLLVDWAIRLSGRRQNLTLWVLVRADTQIG